MALKASPENQKLGKSAEDAIVEWWRAELAGRNSKVIVQRSPYQTSAESRLNAVLADVWFRRTPEEAPFVVIEAKGANEGYPTSFSLSDVEYRTSQARWVTVRGPAGIWHCRFDDAKSLAQCRKGTDDKTYYTCDVRIAMHELTDTILDQIQAMVDEK